MDEEIAQKKSHRKTHFDRGRYAERALWEGPVRALLDELVANRGDQVLAVTCAARLRDLLDDKVNLPDTLLDARREVVKFLDAFAPGEEVQLTFAEQPVPVVDQLPGPRLVLSNGQNHSKIVRIDRIEALLIRRKITGKPLEEPIDPDEKPHSGNAACKSLIRHTHDSEGNCVQREPSNLIVPPNLIVPTDS